MRGQACTGERPPRRICVARHPHKVKFRHLGHLLSENGHGLVVDVELAQADGDVEREAALATVKRNVSDRSSSAPTVLRGP